jgi:glycerol-3-phosphate acyltransferase PlsX
MGSDTHPGPEIDAASQASERWPDTFILVGPESELLPNVPASAQRIEIVHAPDVLGMTEKPAKAARSKPDNSMAVGMRLIKSGEADAFVTAGNTGGAMAAALFELRRVRGVKRPALCPTFPVMNGKAIMIDIGANADCRPLHLLQFAILGALYSEIVYKIEAPRVALLTTGEETGKGNELVKETYPMLEESGLNFIGNIEPKEFYAGNADVAVSDGFVGNIFLKTSEAIGKYLFDHIRQEISARPLAQIGALLARPAFRAVAKLLDPAEYGAVPLLGVDGLVLIGHGRSDARALVNALRVARDAVRGNLMERLRSDITSRLSN